MDTKKASSVLRKYQNELYYAYTSEGIGDDITGVWIGVPLPFSGIGMNSAIAMRVAEKAGVRFEEYDAPVRGASRYRPVFSQVFDNADELEHGIEKLKQARDEFYSVCERFADKALQYIECD